MYTLKLTWQLIQFSTLLGWNQDDSDKAEFYEVAVETLRTLWTTKVSQSRVWPLWLVLLYLLLPLGLIYYMVKEMIRELKT